MCSSRGGERDLRTVGRWCMDCVVEMKCTWKVTQYSEKVGKFATLQAFKVFTKRKRRSIYSQSYSQGPRLHHHLLQILMHYKDVKLNYNTSSDNKNKTKEQTNTCIGPCSMERTANCIDGKKNVMGSSWATTVDLLIKIINALGHYKCKDLFAHRARSKILLKDILQSLHCCVHMVMLFLLRDQNAKKYINIIISPTSRSEHYYNYYPLIYNCMLILQTK